MVIGILTALTAVQAATPLSPSGNWRLQAENNYCLLSRNFGPNRDAVLAIEPVFNTDMIEMMTMLPNVAAERRAGDGQIVFDADKSLTASFWSTSSKDGQTRITRYILPKSALSRFAHTSLITIRTAGSEVAFRVSASKNAEASLSQCQSDLAEIWSSPENGIERPAKLAANVAQFFSHDNYPEAARDAKEEGEVKTVLLIAPDGRAKDCRITKTESAILAPTTCAIALANFKFLPAQGAQGKLLWSTYNLRVRWALP